MTHLFFPSGGLLFCFHVWMCGPHRWWLGAHWICHFWPRWCFHPMLVWWPHQWFICHYSYWCTCICLYCHFLFYGVSWRLWFWTGCPCWWVCMFDSDWLINLLVEHKCHLVLCSKDKIYFLIYFPYVPSPMCPYLSLYCHNPHTLIRINRCTLWSLRQFYCITNLASTLSTSFCSYILNAVCCWVGHMIGRFHRILCNFCSLWVSFSFPYFHPVLYLYAYGTCVMWSVFFEWRVTVIATWKGGGLGGATVPFFSSFCLHHPLLGAGPSLSMLVEAFALFLELSNWYCGTGFCCNIFWSLFIPWLTMSANSPSAFTLLQSFNASAVARIWRTSHMESASRLWLYLYLDTILRWAALIYVPKVCCAAHSVLESITTAQRLLCTCTPYPCDFTASADMRLTLVTTVSLQSKNFFAMLTNFRPPLVSPPLLW